MVLMVPPLAIILVFAPQLLELWLDPTFAAASATALRILAVGVFANGLAQIPLVTLYAFSRPDLPAKFHLGELVVFIPLSILLIQRFGIAGAAMAWTIRVWIDLLLLLAGSARSLGVTIPVVIGGRGARIIVAALALLATLTISTRVIGSPAMLALLAIVSVGIFLWLGWSWILMNAERSAIARMTRKSS
jgi:peptidoglycan biosynthesis protein MviN/MurJ (putative lipid II flippase)